jgi:hypothetical protein
VDPGGLTFNSFFFEGGYWEFANLVPKPKPPGPPSLPGEEKKKRWQMPKLPKAQKPLPNVDSSPPKPNGEVKEPLLRIREIKPASPANRLSGPMLVNPYRIRTLQSEIDRSKGKKRDDLGYLTHNQRTHRKKRIRRLLKRIERIVDDTHRKMITVLIKKFALVLIPKFSVKGMIGRGAHRVISRKSVANLIRWKHYQFRKRLMAKAKFTACSVIEINEAYTSKTCTGCGKIDHNLGGKRVFRCSNPRCTNKKSPRDANGARNSWIRYAVRFIEGHQFVFSKKRSVVYADAKYFLSR